MIKAMECNAVNNLVNSLLQKHFSSNLFIVVLVQIVEYDFKVLTFFILRAQFEFLFKSAGHTCAVKR